MNLMSMLIMPSWSHIGKTNLLDLLVDIVFILESKMRIHCSLQNGRQYLKVWLAYGH